MQNSNIFRLFFNHIDQRDLTAVTGKARIDLGLQIIIDALVDRAVGIDHWHLGVWCLDGQLAAHAISGVINYGIIQKGFAETINPGGEALQADSLVFRLFFTRLAVGNAGFSVLSAGLGNKYADANARGVLLFQQIGQIIVGGIGNSDSGHENSSQTCQQFTPIGTVTQSPSIFVRLMPAPG